MLTLFIFAFQATCHHICVSGWNVFKSRCIIELSSLLHISIRIKPTCYTVRCRAAKFRVLLHVAR